jgi:anti-sigma B factor antagonist
MQITIADVDGATKRVTLVGRLDIAGAGVIELPLAAAAGTGGNILVDMTGVDLITSIAIHHLVKAAKAVARRAGRLVLLGAKPAVAEVLVVAGLEQVLPMVQSESEARAAFAGGG